MSIDTKANDLIRLQLGDFDLIFGATKLNLKIVEVPVRYRRRRYGKTQISRFRHRVLLIQMVIFAYKILKVV
jgi:hypothetical protein